MEEEKMYTIFREISWNVATPEDRRKVQGKFDKYLRKIGCEDLNWIQLGLEWLPTLGFSASCAESWRFYEYRAVGLSAARQGSANLSLEMCASHPSGVLSTPLSRTAKRPIWFNPTC
jgi:hypothetical protein